MFLQDPKMAESTLKITIDGDGHKIYTAGFEKNNGSLVYVIDFRMDKIKKLVFKDITIETPGYKVSTTHGDIIIQSDVAFIGTGISGMDLVERNGGKIDLGEKGDYLAGLYGNDVIINSGEVKGSNYCGVQAANSLILRSGNISENLIGMMFGGESLTIEDGNIAVEGNSDSDFEFHDVEQDVRFNIQNTAYEYLNDRPKFKVQEIVRNTEGEIVERVDKPSPSGQFDSINGKKSFYERFGLANVYEKFVGQDFLQAQVQIASKKNIKVLMTENPSLPIRTAKNTDILKSIKQQF